MKTRSSSGVGTKVDLEYDIETLRITDAGEDAQENGTRPSGSSILSKIKTGSTITAKEDTPKITAAVDSSKLKNMLAGLKSKES
jgi:hypothetical protein